MNTVIFAGSPREGMFSDRMAEMYKKLSDGKLYHLRKEKIGPCHGCGYCKEINCGECIQRDNMGPIYKDVRKADTVAIFSPIYWWQVTAQTKLFMDRLYALEGEEWEGKRLVVVLNGAASDDDREFETLKDAFSQMAEYLKVDLFFLGVGTESEEDWKEKKERVEEFLKSTLL